MDHFTQPEEIQIDRFGFHYFHNNEEYSINKAKYRLQQLSATKAKWLILKNPVGRAIPEDFIQIANKHKFHLIIDFQERIGDFSDFSEISTFLQVYGKWGVEYACLFNQPNKRANWGDAQWISNDIVSTHADLFLRFARICIDNKIHPIFSTLFPGGEYGDLAFLENSLKIIKVKADPSILENMVISAYGWHHNHPLDWGTGGKKHWPEASLFNAPKNYQDHRGFRLYEWYSEITQKIFGRKMPTIIFETGRSGTNQKEKDGKRLDWSQNIDSTIKLLSGENVFRQDDPNNLYTPIGQEVIACCYCLNSSLIEKEIKTDRSIGNEIGSQNFPFSNKTGIDNRKTNPENLNSKQFPYNRYVYIDQPLQSRVPELLEQIDPYIKKHRPFIGFSLLEGLKSAFLIVVTDDKERFLQKNREILEDGNLVKMIAISALHELLNEENL